MKINLIYVDAEKEFLDKLREINNKDYMPPFEIYLWYDRDNDKVELSNLNRQIIFNSKDIGNYKVNVKKKKIKLKNKKKNLIFFQKKTKKF